MRSLRAVPEITRGGGAQALFCLVGAGCIVDVSEGWGVGVTCPGGQGIFNP